MLFLKHSSEIGILLILRKPPFKVHRLELNQLPENATTNSAELLTYYKSM